MADEIFNHFMERLSYCQETGLFRWLDDRFGHCEPGQIAGSRDSLGYVILNVQRRRLKAHRLAWRVVAGAWPSGVIDHINGDPSDNRICNLRDVTPVDNRQNQRRARSDSTTGVQGVHPRGRGFVVYLTANGRRRRVGSFPTTELAHAAYLQAKRQLHAAFPG